MVTVVICEKPSQARNLRAALVGRFGEILAARGHLLELAEPQEVRPEWARWSTELLHPGGPYPLKPAPDRTDALNRIKAALRGADEVIVATDMGREGHLIGMEIVEHLRFRGRVRRASFNAEDPETIRTAFGRLTDASEHAGLLAAGKARQQADQICNLTLTRAATVRLTGPGRGVIGVGRVRTPALAIVCRREQEITDFTPEVRWAVLADIAADVGTFTAACTSAPGSDGPITDRSVAGAIVGAAQGWEGSIHRQSRTGRRGPPAPHDLAALQADAGRQLKWTAKRTLDTAQKLYSELKLITYPRVDARVWPEAMAADAGGLRRAVCSVLAPDREPGGATVRTGAGRDSRFSDKRLEGHEHHAIAPNAAAAGDFQRLWGSCTDDQRRLAAIVFRRYAAITSADWTFTATTLSLGVSTPDGTAEFTAGGKSTDDPGWTEWERPPPEGPKEGEEDGNAKGLPPIGDGDRGRCTGARPAERKTRPPSRYAEGSIITAMKEAWKFLPEGDLRERLKEAGGIGTPATRDQVVETLVRQGQIAREKGRFRPTEAGLALWRILERRAPAIVDPGTTAAWEAEFDRIAAGDGRGWMELVDRLAQATATAVAEIEGETEGALDGLDRGQAAGPGRRRGRAKAGKGPASDRQLNLIRKLAAERGEELDEGSLASMTAADASAGIDRLMATGRPAGGGGNGGRDRTPSPARLRYAEDLAKRHGVELPEECRTDWRRAKAFIDRWAGNRPAEAEGRTHDPTP